MEHRAQYQIIKVVASIIFDNSSDSSDDSSESEEEHEDEMMLQIRGKTIKKPRVQLFIENVVDHYNEVDFKSHFRVTRRTCDHLLNVLGERISYNEAPAGPGGHPFTEPKQQLLFALWILGNQESYR